MTTLPSPREIRSAIERVSNINITKNRLLGWGGLVDQINQLLVVARAYESGRLIERGER